MRGVKSGGIQWLTNMQTYNSGTPSVAQPNVKSTPSPDVAEPGGVLCGCSSFIYCPNSGPGSRFVSVFVFVGKIFGSG